MGHTYKTGDIIIFKAPKDQFLSQCIAWLTNSDVSHAAMIYGEDSIFESGIKNAAVSSIGEEAGDTAYVLRLTPSMDAAPLVATATAYREAGIGYDFPALVIVGGLLVFSKIPATAKIIKLTSRILLPACLALDKILHDLINSDAERTMICSQLIYQVFYDTGSEYQLRFKDAIIPLDKLSLRDVVCLADLLPEDELADFDSLQFIAESNENIEDLAKDLLEALLESDSSSENDSAYKAPTEVVDYSDVLPGVSAFISKLEVLKEKLQLDVPVDGLFITPADILERTLNLERIGMTKIVYIKDSEE